MAVLDRPVLDRPSLTGLRLVDRAAGDLPALLLVLTPVALLNVLVGVRPAAAPARSETDAVVAAHVTGAAAGTVGFRGQLGVVQAVAGAAWDASLLQSARGTGLLAGLACAALLWPVLRRLGLSGNAAATAVIVAGLGPLALRLQPSVDPGALAAFWIALAGGVGFRTRLGAAGVVAVLAALLVAVVTTPVAAAGLLAGFAHAVLGGAVLAGIGSRSRVAVGALAAVAALAVGGVAAWPTDGGTAVPLLSVVTVALLAVAVLPRSWVRRPELRVLPTMIVVWLAVAVLPGPARQTALLLAVPALALLIGALLGDAGADRSPRLSIAAATAVTAALVSGLVTVLWPVAPPQSSSYEPVANWLNGELDQGVVLSAAPLDRAELVAAGVPVDRFAIGSVPAGAVTVVPGASGCGTGGTAVAQLPGGSGVINVCAAAAPPGGAYAGPGSLLAANQAVRLADPARQLLEENRVDERLISVLAGAAATQPIEIADFPVVPGEPDTSIRRVAVLTGVVRAVDVNGRPAASALELYLNAQQPPLRPDLSSQSDGRLVVHFRLQTRQ